MADVTVYSSTNISLESDDSTDYEAARAGTGDIGVSTLGFRSVGNGNRYDGGGEYFIFEWFAVCDLFAAGMTLGQTASAATLAIADDDITEDGDWNVEARLHNWAGSPSWVDGDSLGGLTRLTSLPVSSLLGAGSYVVMTADGTNLLTAVNAALAGAGKLWFVLNSESTVLDVANGGYNYLGGGGDPPRLVVTPAATSKGAAMHHHLQNMGAR